MKERMRKRGWGMGISSALLISLLLMGNGASVYAENSVDGLSSASRQPQREEERQPSVQEEPEPVQRENAWICLECCQVRDTNFCGVCGENRPGNEPWTCSVCKEERNLDYCEKCGEKKMSAAAGTYKARGESGLYGYIDREGRISIDVQYDYADEFNGGRALVFSGTLGKYDMPEEGVYGYIDEKGEMVLPLMFEEASAFQENGSAAVCLNGKYGLINTRGEVLADFVYDYMAPLSETGTFKAFRGTMRSGHIPEEGTYSVLKSDGSLLFAGPFWEIAGYREYYIVTDRDLREAVFSLEGDQLMDFTFDSLWYKGSERVGFEENGRYGYADLMGNQVVPAVCNRIGTFYEGKAVAEKKGKYYLIDLMGDILMEYDADYVSDRIDAGVTYAFEGTMSSSGYPEEGSVYLMRAEDGTYLSRGYKKENVYAVYNGHWIVKEEGIWYVLDLDGNELFSVQGADSLILCDDGCYAAQKDQAWALLDEKGRWMTDYEWDWMDHSDQSLKAVRSLPEAAGNIGKDE